jgi:cell division protein FtsW (lipid II flippase)
MSPVIPSSSRLLLLLPVLCFGLLVISFFLPTTINPATAKMTDSAVKRHFAFFAVGLISFVPALSSYRLFFRRFSRTLALLCWLGCAGSVTLMLGYMLWTGGMARGWYD